MRRLAWTLLLATSLAGCPKSTPKTAPVTGPPATEVPSGAPFVAPGERMTYRVTLHDVTLATFAVVVGEVGTLHGHQTVVVQAGATTAGVAALVKKVSAEFATWLDVKTGQPVMFRVTETVGADDDTIEQSEARFFEMTPGVLPMSTTKPDGTTVAERQVITRTPIDIITFLMSARAWDGRDGERRTLEVVRSRYMWRTEATLVGRTSLVTELGQLPAVRFDAVTSRINRDGTDDKSIAPREFQLWVSDDADRVPLLLVAESDYGNIKMEIVDYTQGTAPNLSLIKGP